MPQLNSIKDFKNWHDGVIRHCFKREVIYFWEHVEGYKWAFVQWVRRQIHMRRRDPIADMIYGGKK